MRLLIDRLIDRYLDGLATHQHVWIDREAFRRLFDLTSIQRNLKAAGRFVYIDRVKGNPKFLADIPRVLGYVKRNLLKYPELDPAPEASQPLRAGTTVVTNEVNAEMQILKDSEISVTQDSKTQVSLRYEGHDPRSGLGDSSETVDEYDSEAASSHRGYAADCVESPAAEAARVPRRRH